MSATAFQDRHPRCRHHGAPGKAETLADFKKPLEGVGWEYGMHSGVMKDFRRLLDNIQYDWRKQVSRLSAIMSRDMPVVNV